MGFDPKALPEPCRSSPAARRQRLRACGNRSRCSTTPRAYGTHVQLRTTLWANSIIERRLEQLREQVRLVFGALPDDSYPELMVQHTRDVDAADYYRPGRASALAG